MLHGGGHMEPSNFLDNIVQKKDMSRLYQYDYTDEHGKVLRIKIRMKSDQSGEKSFKWYHRNVKGDMVIGADHCRKTLYKLPQVLKGISEKQPIFLVEGEKDADTLANHGLVATTTGHSSEWKGEY